MKLTKHAQQTLALAGVVQAAQEVNQLACHGIIAQEELGTLINSLFITHPKTTTEVYGGIRPLQRGIKLLETFLSKKQSVNKQPEVIRYVLSLLFLEGKLRHHKSMLSSISHELELIRSQSSRPEDFCLPSSLSRLAALYQETLGSFSFRIQVKGEMGLLQQKAVADKVRAVLLAGIRSAILWRQLGGRRWQLLLSRQRILRDIQALHRETAEAGSRDTLH